MHSAHVAIARTFEHVPTSAPVARRLLSETDGRSCATPVARSGTCYPTEHPGSSVSFIHTAFPHGRRRLPPTAGSVAPTPEEVAPTTLVGGGNRIEPVYRALQVLRPAARRAAGQRTCWSARVDGRLRTGADRCDRGMDAGWNEVSHRTAKDQGPRRNWRNEPSQSCAQMAAATTLPSVRRRSRRTTCTPRTRVQVPRPVLPL